MIPLLLTLVACAPKIPPGPVPVEEAARPVRLLERAPEPGPNVYLQAIVAAGSAWDPPGKEGLAGLTARALVDAGAGDRTAEEVRGALFPTGSAFEVVADRDWISLRLTCHQDFATLCVDLFADALVAPRFEEPDVLRLRDEALYHVTEGLLADEEALGAEVLDAWLFEGHPYGHPVSGRAGTLPLLGPDDLRAFHQDRYRRATTRVGIAGSWSPEHRDRLAERLVALPGTLPKPTPLRAPAPVEGRSLLVVDTGTPVTGFHLGHPLAVTRDHPDWPALFLAITAFGDHRQSHGRLFRAMRAERGLNYGDYAYVEPFVQRGWSAMPEQGVLRRQPHFSLWIRPTSVENGPFALKLAIDELERFVTHGLEEQELEDIRAYLIGKLPLLARDPGRRLAYALDAEATGTPDLLETLPAAVADLTLEEVNAAVKRHLRPDDLRIVAVSGEADDLVRRLVEESETPIVYQDVRPGAEQSARDATVAAKALDLDAERAKVKDARGIFR